MSKREEFLALFKAEAGEYVTTIDKGLVDLEKDPGNLELVKELNRVAHTLKGAARIFKFNEIQDITHKMEEIFSRVHHGQMAFTVPVADKIFKGLDLIKIMLEKVGKGETIDVDVSTVCRELDECLGIQEALARNQSASNASAEVLKDKFLEPANPVEKRDQPQGMANVDEYVRVPLSRVKTLLNLVGEIVINKMKSSAKISRAKKIALLSRDVQSTLSSLSEILRRETGQQENAIKLIGRCNSQIQKLKESSVDLFNNLSSETFHLDPIIDELQSNVKNLRMLPVSTIFEGFPRMVRDIALQNAKEVNLQIIGEGTELDKKVLEGLKSPLMHILRNSIDHGIESPEQRLAAGKPRIGTIKLSASHEAGSVIIKVEDDGQGIDLERIKQIATRKSLISNEELASMEDNEIRNMVFMNGFSTSPIITDISGRGIGLDIVRRSIESLKGKVTFDSERGKSTTFTLILPLTIALIHVLLIRAQDLLFALPVNAVTETLRINVTDVSTMEGRMAFHLRGHTLPLVRLSDCLGLPARNEDGGGREKELNTIIVSSLDKKVGLIVDKIMGEEEVFIKGLGEHLGKVRNVSGATILWTGEVAVILDVDNLIENSRLSHPAVSGRKMFTEKKVRERKILVCDDALSTRELEKSLIESYGYLVDTAVDGMDGFEKFSQIKYDLVVTDVEMPRMNGFDLSKNIRKSEQNNDIPIILVTALDKEEDKRRGIEAGASAYIVKTSFDQSTLMDTIERLIG